MSRRRQKPTRDSIPNRKSSIALAHAYAATIACTVFLSDVLCSLQIHGAWLRLAVVARLISGLLPHMLISYHHRLEKGVCVRLYCRWLRENPRYRPLRKGFFASGQVSRPDDVDCIVASPFASKDAFPICFAMIHVMNV